MQTCYSLQDAHVYGQPQVREPFPRRWVRCSQGQQPGLIPHRPSVMGQGRPNWKHCEFTSCLPNSQSVLAWSTSEPHSALPRNGSPRRWPHTAGAWRDRWRLVCRALGPWLALTSRTKKNTGPSKARQWHASPQGRLFLYGQQYADPWSSTELHLK